MAPGVMEQFGAPSCPPLSSSAGEKEPVEGALPDLGFVEGCCDTRQSCLNLLPKGLAGDAGPGRLPRIVSGTSARRNVGAVIGPWARSTEVVYSVRSSSSSELEGAGRTSPRPTKGDGVGLRLRPAATAPHCMARILDAQVKTDCLLTQLEAHLGAAAAAERRSWNETDDSRSTAWRATCCSGLPGTGRRTWPGRSWRGCESRARRCTWSRRRIARRRTWGWRTDGRPLGAQVRARGQRWLVVEEITQLDMALWADLACVGLNGDVKFLLLGVFRQLRAGLQRPVGAQPAGTWPAGAGTSSQRTLQPRRLRLCEVAAGRGGGVPHAGAGQGEAEGALPLEARLAGHHAGMSAHSTADK